MKANINVTNRKEADAIRSGLEDPEVRAMVIVSGLLRQLPDDKTRHRVLNFVMDKLGIVAVGSL